MLDTYLLIVKVRQANSVYKLRYKDIPFLFRIISWCIYDNISSKSFNEKIWYFFKTVKLKQFHHIIKIFCTVDLPTPYPYETCVTVIRHHYDVIFHLGCNLSTKFWTGDLTLQTALNWCCDVGKMATLLLFIAIAYAGHKTATKWAISICFH